MTRGRVTVTGQVTGVRMMVTPGAGVTWCAGPTTARSLDIIIMRRTTAARDQNQELLLEYDISFQLVCDVRKKTLKVL